MALDFHMEGLSLTASLNLGHCGVRKNTDHNCSYCSYIRESVKSRDILPPNQVLKCVYGQILYTCNYMSIRQSWTDDGRYVTAIPAEQHYHPEALQGLQRSDDFTQ